MTTIPANVHALLVNTLGEGSESWFEVIAAGDIVPAKKPAPDIYFYAMEKMNITADKCIAFEDSHNGILATSDAGLRTIITTNGYTHDDDFNGAVAVLTNMGEPDAPFEVLQGDKALLENSGYISVKLLKQMFD